MTDREKLINLIMQRFDWQIAPETEYKIIINANLGELVDALISHGVTVREMQKPLAVEEVSEYLGEIIWKEELFLDVIPIVAFHKGWRAIEYEEFGGDECESSVTDYNHTWRCWAEKPT